MPSRGDWLVVQDLLNRGEPEFVDRLKDFSDAETLGPFADSWYANPSPVARRLLLDYLEGPLNAPRHEPLVKRLFKWAYVAGDDSAMARFLVALDRSLRRVERQRRKHQRKSGSTRARRPKAWSRSLVISHRATGSRRGHAVAAVAGITHDDVSLLSNVWMGRRDLIPPEDDVRTHLVNRGMVTLGLITPDQLAEVHAVGAEMDWVRPTLASTSHQASLVGEAAVQADR
jgi:hypothetical protein